MCGRFTATANKKKIEEQYGVSLAGIDIKARYNVAPSQDALVIIHTDERKAEMMRWGLIPHWAKDESIGHKMINARAESVSEKPSFRDSFKRRRCLVVADGFYEWQKTGDRKRPVYIFLKGQPVFGFAGLWDEWKNEKGEVIRTFTIITTEANDFMRPIHERMPVIIAPEDEDRWLDPDLKDEKILKEMLKPYDPQEMDFREVSTMVNSPKFDSPDCVKSISIG